ncbi:hypothetical protein [Methanosarcina sp. MTP4]|uniref:hypothetical protein n=1 Tax=Methanosarcina sp. MTP4 TaxID=1434100 RepID=UPI0012E023FD|nr:hypothetical protein [Methanosarcina sp. MTP4]
MLRINGWANPALKRPVLQIASISLKIRKPGKQIVIKYVISGFILTAGAGMLGS